MGVKGSEDHWNRVKSVAAAKRWMDLNPKLAQTLTALGKHAITFSRSWGQRSRSRSEISTSLTVWSILLVDWLVGWFIDSSVHYFINKLINHAFSNNFIQLDLRNLKHDRRDTSDCTRGSDVNKMSACWHRNVVCCFLSVVLEVLF